jgi:hypothetical protein
MTGFVSKEDDLVEGLDSAMRLRYHARNAWTEALFPSNTTQHNTTQTAQKVRIEDMI